jgi:hypothetical protein
MNKTRMPGFTAAASFYRSNAHYQGGAMLAGLRQGGEVIVHAARRIAYCSMKGCCVDLRDLGFSRICCNGDECGPNVLI